MLETSTVAPSLSLAALGILLAAVVATLAGSGLRALRVPGGGILGGLATGVLLGPLVLGAIAPSARIELFVGPAALRADWIAAERAVAGARVAAAATMANADQEALRLEGRAEAARQRWDDARREHRMPMTVVLVASAIAIAATAFSRGAAPRAPRVDDLLLGAWEVVAPTCLALVFCAFLGHGPLTPVALATAAIASCGPWRVAREERAIARGCGAGSDREAATAGVVTTACALLLLFGALRSIGGAAVVGGLAAAIAWASTRAMRRQARTASWVVERCLVPSAVSLMVVTVDPVGSLSVVTIVFLFVIAEDGRWLGAWLGRSLGGHAAGRAMRFAMAGLGVAPTMVAFTAVGAVTETVPPSLVLAALVSAFLLEFLAGARLRLANRLDALASENELQH